MTGIPAADLVDAAKDTPLMTHLVSTYVDVAPAFDGTTFVETNREARSYWGGLLTGLLLALYGIAAEKPPSNEADFEAVIVEVRAAVKQLVDDERARRTAVLS